MVANNPLDQIASEGNPMTVNGEILSAASDVFGSLEEAEQWFERPGYRP
jgi:uncharacterized protein (DUF2384 family)